jgi:hypothetical protein
MTGIARPSASLAGLALRPGKSASQSAKDGDITDRIVASTAAQPTPPPPPRRAPASEPPPRSEEIVVYWERLRRGRAVPPIAELDRSLVGNAWPDSLIVMFDRDAMMPRISRLGATDGEIEYTPMVTDWILSRARQAARRAEKLEEVQTFPLEGASARYRLFLLPLAMDANAAGGVLCHLCRA